jgi:hypothetical protein
MPILGQESSAIARSPSRHLGALNHSDLGAGRPLRVSSEIVGGGDAGDSSADNDNVFGSVP